MFDFSNDCKYITKEKIIACALGLNKTELIIFSILLENNKNNKEITSKCIKSKLNLDITNIQRYLKNLIEKDLVIRSKHNLSTSGYIYIYKIKDLSYIKQKILENTTKLFEKIEQEIIKI